MPRPDRCSDRGLVWAYLSFSTFTKLVGLRPARAPGGPQTSEDQPCQVADQSAPPESQS
jgi:hypothetical protein